MLFYMLCSLNIRVLPMGMVLFTLGKLSFNLFYEGRISFISLRFLVAYIVLLFKKDLTVDEFVSVLCGVGILF